MISDITGRAGRAGRVYEFNFFLNSGPWTAGTPWKASWGCVHHLNLNFCEKHDFHIPKWSKMWFRRKSAGTLFRYWGVYQTRFRHVSADFSIKESMEQVIFLGAIIPLIHSKSTKSHWFSPEIHRSKGAPVLLLVPEPTWQGSWRISCADDICPKVGPFKGSGLMVMIFSRDMNGDLMDI